MKKFVAYVVRLLVGVALASLVILPAFVSYAEAAPAKFFNNKIKLVCQDDKGHFYFLDSLSVEYSAAVSKPDGSKKAILSLLDTDGLRHFADSSAKTHDFCKIQPAYGPY